LHYTVYSTNYSATMLLAIGSSYINVLIEHMYMICNIQVYLRQQTEVC